MMILTWLVLAMTDSALNLNPDDSGNELEEAAGSAIHFQNFESQKKRLFVTNALRLWPNLTKLCASVGITPSSYYKHLKLHPDFAALMKMIDESVTDDIEQVLRHEASNPKSFLDRMAYLRAHRPELYDRAKVVKIEGYKMGDRERVNRLGAVDTVIDGEITKTYLDRKQIRINQQQSKLNAGVKAREETGGEGDGNPQA